MNLTNKNNIQALNHNVSLGLNYFNSYIVKNLSEHYFKLFFRGGIDLPSLSIPMSMSHIRPIGLNLLAYSAGVENVTGVNYYFLKRNSYISPEIGVNYDFFNLQKFNIQKAPRNVRLKRIISYA